MEITGICALCEKEKTLKKSHIVPKFIGEWIRNTSKAEHLRNLMNPNKPEQDLPKPHLLCEGCEGILNKAETPFSSNIFYNYHNGSNRFDYDDWLLKFVISLSWRVGTLYFTQNTYQNSHVHNQLKKALNIWSEYLLEKRNDPGLYAHHLYFIDKDKYSSINSVVLKDYAFRVIDTHVRFSFNGHIIIYNKLPGMVIVSYINPISVRGWKGTQLHSFGTARVGSQKTPPEIPNYLLDRAKLFTSKYLNGLSDRQKVNIKSKILKKSEINNVK
ncbi:hypothetical protein GC096_17220 [Paenibacillus sp. LMG 31461]|uniref:HNH endonuclease n=1 Tax=Paenibacillus plantarum TaxID=2654975 RepID=A0ABX1XCU9_9BACL|nr:hypothetical protein [Paenibacillus plantarum]NOU65779.1 hypothetical protein [Paenibacillus plantarum]